MNQHNTATDHATEALRLIDATDRGVADAHAVAAAQIHATLAVAAELREVADHVLYLAGRTGGP